MENSDDTESTENVSLEHNSGKAKIILTGHKYSERNDCLILTFLILIFTITVKLWIFFELLIVSLYLVLVLVIERSNGYAGNDKESEILKWFVSL